MSDLSSPSPHIVITEQDQERLLAMLDRTSGPAAESLETEIDRALVVRQADVPPDVVTMNSLVVYEDCAGGGRRTVRLVYPAEASLERGQVSVLAPIGSALLGLKVGQEIEWQVPTGLKRIRVVEIRYQPEAAGDLHL